MPRDVTKSAPLVSVIIPTFNWSAALRHAIESVIRQDFDDFELLVVGDACTDDSEAVAKSFGDRRIRWFNLPTNHGSQWAANNFGIENAEGSYIAYLGHDDIWWPTHLSSTVAAARRADADVVAAVTIMYGPPGSGMRAATGLFPGDTFDPRYMFPPSSMLHRRTLVDRTGPWRAPGESRGAVDYDLVLRFHESGATFAATAELTVFKFNAAWRRNAYKRRDASEQADLLGRIAREGEALRQQALISIVRSVIEDRFIRIETPPATAVPATVSHRMNGRFKGTQSLDPALLPPLPPAGMRFFIDEPYAAYEWHPIETRRDGRWPWRKKLRWRWTGPNPQSSFYLPVRIDRPARLSLHVIGILATDPAAALETAQLLRNDQPLASDRRRQPDDTWLWSADLDPGPSLDSGAEMVTIHFPTPRRPLDLGINQDRRWLGLGIGEIEIRPR